VAVNFKIKIEI